jgi:hypothetical protein
MIMNNLNSMAGKSCRMSIGAAAVVALAALAGGTACFAQTVAVTITAPPEIPTIDYYQEHLTPYGQWVDVAGVGTAWVPAEANVPGWRPYMDAGQWEYTDAGWYWQSTYPWGDMAFHYGRWVNNGFTGGRWAWVPGYDWAPSWVSWREGGAGMGWAPLPWDVEYHAGVGLYWHGGPVVAGVDFGLGFGAFVCVGNDHFWGGNYNAYVFNEEQSRAFYANSTFHAGYVMEGGHLKAEGLGRDHIAAVTHHAVVVHKAAELRHTEETHNFAKRTTEHKELTRAPQRGASARPSDARSTAPATASNTRPGATTERGATTRVPEARPGAAESYSKEPTANSKPLAANSKPPESKPRAPETKPKVPEVKPKPPEAKPKAPEPKPKPPESKPPEI